jgi:hypothetical protein
MHRLQLASYRGTDRPVMVMSQPDTRLSATAPSRVSWRSPSKDVQLLREASTQCALELKLKPAVRSAHRAVQSAKVGPGDGWHCWQGSTQHLVLVLQPPVEPQPPLAARKGLLPRDE